MQTVTMGRFFGIGVGPGPAKFLPVAALEALQKSDLIFAPKARGSEHSIAKLCLAGLDLPEDRFREVLFNMDPERDQIESHYHQIALSIVSELRCGKTVSYLTIGDSLTYSTYSYALQAIIAIAPDLQYETFPGITSYAAAASVLGFPLGQGKERTLILPCPDNFEDLRRDINTHDIVILMKIGMRFADVLAVINDMGIAKHCALASRLGLAGEFICNQVEGLESDSRLGYLTTMLIRKAAKAGEIQ